MKENAVCIGFLLLLTLFFFAEVIFTSNTFIARDIYLFYNPRQFYAAESMRSGLLPLWNPYVACGVPFQANLQSALFYPLNLIYYILPFQQGFKYFIVLHYFLGAAFMFLLMRQWGARREGAVLAGIVFALGGYLTSIQDNVAFLAAGIWLPLVLVCFHRAAVTGRLFYTILTGACIAAQVFAGDASFFLLSSAISTFLYAAYHCIFAARGSARKIITALLLAWAIGLSLSAIQLVPFWEFATQSHRFSGLSFAQATKWSYHPLELLQLLIPYPFGTTVPGTRWFGQLWLDTLYIGFFPLLFALLGLLADKRKLRYFLAAVLTVNLLLSFGSFTPLYKALYTLVPVFQMLQYPVKFLFLVGFALAVFAGRGFDWFICAAEDHKKSRVSACVLSVLVLAVLLPLLGNLVWGDELYAAFLNRYPVEDYFKPIAQKQYYSVLYGCSIALIAALSFALIYMGARKKIITSGVFIFLVFGITAADLRLARPQDPLIRETAIEQQSATAAVLHKDHSQFRIYSLARFYAKGFSHLYNIPFDRSYRFLREALRANLNMYEHIASVEEYSEMLNKSFYDLFLPVESYFSGSGDDLNLRAYCRMLFNLLNVKYLISPLPRPDLGFKLIAKRFMYIYENEQVLPRAFFPHQVEKFATSALLLRAMQTAGFDPRKTACVIAGGPEIKEEQIFAGIPGELKSNVQWTSCGSQQYSLETTRDKPGLLVVSDSFYPGWKVFVDGREAELLRVNYFMRGVLVDKGRHEVLFVFKPLSFTLGGWISALALLTSLVVLIRGMRQSRRQKALMDISVC